MTDVDKGRGYKNCLKLVDIINVRPLTCLGTQKVECASYDGRNRRVVSQSAGYPFGLAYNNEVLYWTDWEK